MGLLFQPDLKKIIQVPFQTRAAHLLHDTEKMFIGAGASNTNLTARRFICELDGIALHYLSVFKDFPLDEMLEELFKNYKGLGK